MTNSQILSHFSARFPLSRLKYRVATDSWLLKGRSVSSSELSRVIAFELDTSKTRIENMLTHVSLQATLASETRVAAWLRQVEARPVTDETLRAWLKLMEHPETSTLMHEANVVAMKQWIWQVKRNIQERPVVWHVAPTFWSREGGTGKSYNVKRLFAPLEEFTRSINVDELNEKFSGKMLAKTLIAFFDEFAGAERVSTSALKSILTGKDIDSRAMYSESGFHAKNRISCIATSNLAPPHGFEDETGARRFWSIKCSSEQMKHSPRMAAFDALPMHEVWQAISVEDQSPAYTTPKEILRFMDEERDKRLRTPSSLENFCEECLDYTEGQRLQLKELSQAYKTYCLQTRQAIVRGGYRVLGLKLQELGMEVVCHANLRYLKHHVLTDFDEIQARAG